MANGESGGRGEGGQWSAVVTTESSVTSLAAPELSCGEMGSVLEDEESESEVRKPEKDPRRIARSYQVDLCKMAMEENIIVYLGTGRGKTHIAVLLIYEMGHLIRKPQKSVCVFLAPTVALVEQQAKVIEDSIDFKVGICKHLKSHRDWRKQIEQYEVLVMTPEILFRSLNHCFIRMELIALLIFDECHHAQIQSNHPYAEIMKVFYKTDALKLPRIFGMTASPVVGKGASDQANLSKHINSLEKLLDAKIYSVEDKDVLESFVASPIVKVYHYDPAVGSTSSFHLNCRVKLKEVKGQCVSMLSRNSTADHKSLRMIKKLLQRMHDNLIFCVENLGLSGALQASRILLSGDHQDLNELIETEVDYGDGSLCNRYLNQAASIFQSYGVGDGPGPDISSVEVLKEPLFSAKLLRLIGILSTFRRQPNMKCIIFVNRIVTARSLSYILQNLKFLESWKCNILVGVHSGLKNVSRKTMNGILEKFRTGELNLLVATKVGEEGLDIQTCCLVIRFDLPETVASFIQSRGRARMPQSEYAFLVDSRNHKELDLIKNFTKDEDRIIAEIASRTSSETFEYLEDTIYKVDSSGASISSGYSISLLQHYCSKLPRDEYFDPKPEFFYFDDSEGTVCSIILPSNAPIRQVVSTPQPSTEAAKKDACLKACKELHELGALTDYLLPNKDDAELIFSSSDSDSSEDEDVREELHEMLVPAALKEPWNDTEKLVHLNCYYIKFIPIPGDRLYKKFGLFVKAPLPKEAEKMEVDLHLSHGRSVITKLIPSGVVEFDQDEILQAQNFQEMFLKVILERSELVCDLVSLGKNDIHQFSTTFYLLLPVILHEHKNTLTVDWKIIRKCLSSPIFRTPADAVHSGAFALDNYLQLANGPTSMSDIVNSLVYAPYKKTFYFVSQILDDKNGYNQYKESASHIQHLSQTFGIHLSYPGQPLLKAKQLFSLHNLLHDRKQENSELRELEEHFFEIPPELCQLKIIAFSKDIGSSLSLLPSIMHRLENLLVAIELKQMLRASFPEGVEIETHRVLEALTTEKCNERFSLERLEVLGDAFLKFSVGRHMFLLHSSLDEGGLTRKRSNAVNNSNLYELATRKNLQIYIRDQPFDPCRFFALGRPCPVICNKETERTIHYQSESRMANCLDSDVRCSKCHHWLHKKTIADVVESLIGGFIVDSGFKAAAAFLRWIGIRVDFEASQVIDHCLASASYLSLSTCMDIDALENVLGYQFLHRGLLLQAFVHPSYSKHGGGCYQRLEFLGDAVVDYLITSYLYSVYPKLKPGHLTDLRSVSVNNEALANVAICRSFHKFLLCDSSSLSKAVEEYVNFTKTAAPEISMPEGPKCPKVLGDLVESCMGAILLDSGFNLNCVWRIMLSLFDPIMRFSSLQLSPSREVQELCQSYSLHLQFLPSKRGKIFSVKATVTGEDLCTTAFGTNLNKKDAIRIAAKKLCVKLKAQGFVSKSKPLEEVLESSCKMEARLIGYDETPADVSVPNALKFEKLEVQDPSSSNLNPTIYSVDEGPAMICSPCIIRLGRDPPSPQAADESGGDSCSDTGSCTPGGSQEKPARSKLYEICAVNYWKPPLFKCCKEEGASHLKLFTFKAVVVIEDTTDTVFECCGLPKPTKKAAAEQAAEGAIWYMKQAGYLPKS